MKRNDKLLWISLMVQIIVFWIFMAGAYQHKKVIAEQDILIETLEHYVGSLEGINDRYKYIITDMMQGQWSPEQGIQKTFEKEWYGTPIWSFKAVNRPPGSPSLDIGEIMDRKIEEILDRKIEGISIKEVLPDGNLGEELINNPEFHSEDWIQKE